MWDIALRVTREYQPVASLYMRFCLCPVFSSGRGLLNPPGRFMYCLALRVVFLFTALTLAFGSSTCCPDVDPKPAKPIIAIISGSNPPNPSSCSSAGGGGGGGGTSRGGGGGDLARRRSADASSPSGGGGGTSRSSAPRNASASPRAPSPPTLSCLSLLPLRLLLPPLRHRASLSLSSRSPRR